jgi:hypothetical protein
VPGPKDPAIKGVGQFRPMVWDFAKVGADIERCCRDFGKRWGK